MGVIKDLNSVPESQHWKPSPPAWGATSITQRPKLEKVFVLTPGSQDPYAHLFIFLLLIPYGTFSTWQNAFRAKPREERGPKRFMI